MPKLEKAYRRDKSRHKARHGVRTDGRAYLHILNRKNKERDELREAK